MSPLTELPLIGAYLIRCNRCSRPVYLSFKPRTPKVCDQCHAPRSGEELDHLEALKRQERYEDLRRQKCGSKKSKAS